MAEQVSLFSWIARWLLVPLLLLLAGLFVLFWKWFFILLLSALLAVLAVVSGAHFAQPAGRILPPKARSTGRNRFRPDKLEGIEDFDYIVIGSGIGGLTCGSVLGHMGFRVAVLEAHEVAGGALHEFSLTSSASGSKNSKAALASTYAFPSGLHYVIPSCEQVLHASCGTGEPPVKFDRLGEDEEARSGCGRGVYERVQLGGLMDEPAFPIASEKQLKDELRRRFPGLLAQLDRYEALATRVLTCFPLWSALHALPFSARKVLMKTAMPQVWFDYAGRTAEDVLMNEVFADAPAEQAENVIQLVAYLCGLWVDTGCAPHRVSFFMIAAVGLGFPHEGAAYPAGGPSAIAEALVRSIESTGGLVLVRAPVEELLLDAFGHTRGVLLSTQYCSATKITAKLGVVSACGWRNTAKLVERSPNGSGRFPLLDLRQGEGFVMANIGLAGDADALELQCSNLWPQPAGGGVSIFEGVRRYLKDPLGVPLEMVPAMITFPSLKDRAVPRDAPTQTAQVLCLAKTEWFADGDDMSVPDPLPAWRSPRRSQKYDETKVRWEKRIRDLFVHWYPHLEEHIDLFDLSTPATIEHYLPTGSGSAIGLDVNADRSHCRFTDMETMAMLDMKTQVSGLWMTGQDTLLCGVPLAQAAGLLSALRIGGPRKACAFVLQTAWLLLAAWAKNIRTQRHGVKVD